MKKIVSLIVLTVLCCLQLQASSGSTFPFTFVKVPFSPHSQSQFDDFCKSTYSPYCQYLDSFYYEYTFLFDRKHPDFDKRKRQAELFSKLQKMPDSKKKELAASKDPQEYVKNFLLNS